MITVEIDEQFQKDLAPEVLHEFAASLFEQLKIPAKNGMSITISDDALLQQLNSQYLGIDAPTDVLSFPAGFEDPESGGYFYGDIILSYQKASQQAAEGGTATLDEIELLIVHGFLHLLGYDHADNDQKKEMWALQEKVLNALGVQARPSE